MALEEYRRKRRFAATPEPPPKVETKSGSQRRFVVQKHRASRLHYDFRLEMEGVLKSWAVPKGPSLDPADKRLAMMVEDHPVSYFHFEGIIPPGNYGAGTVLVWDTGTWEPLGDASAMLRKGDLKFRLNGEKLKGEFVLAHMRSRRPGSKGTEWLLIKKRDEYVAEGYNIDEFDRSVLTQRALQQITEDHGSAEWESNRKAASSSKTSLLKNKKITIVDPENAERKITKSRTVPQQRRSEVRKQNPRTSGGKTQAAKPVKIKSSKSTTPDLKTPKKKENNSFAGTASSAVIAKIEGAVKAVMPRNLSPMLATLVDAAFDDDQWLFEIKWDGYRALTYIENGKIRLVSRNQNEFESYPELRELPQSVHARQAILDGEIVALDAQGRASFALMQQRAGVTGPGRHRGRGDASIPVVYYAFDLLYLDGYSLFKVGLEQRKHLLQQIIQPSPILRFSDHYVGKGTDLYRAAAQHELEGIVAKRRRSLYIQKRSHEWLKIKITRRQECVIGGYTAPKGSREHFGSLILGLYDEPGRLIPVGQAGSGFTQQSHAAMWERLKKLSTDRNPFLGKPESSRRAYFVRPELVAEIKFSEWTHQGQSGAIKMRAPIFQGLRFDKKPRECIFVAPRSTLEEVKQAEAGEAA